MLQLLLCRDVVSAECEMASTASSSPAGAAWSAGGRIEVKWRHLVAEIGWWLVVAVVRSVVAAVGAAVIETYILKRLKCNKGITTKGGRPSNSLGG